MADLGLGVDHLKGKPGILDAAEFADELLDSEDLVLGQVRVPGCQGLEWMRHPGQDVYRHAEVDHSPTPAYRCSGQPAEMLRSACNWQGTPESHAE